MSARFLATTAAEASNDDDAADNVNDVDDERMLLQLEIIQFRFAFDFCVYVDCFVPYICELFE